MATDDGEAERRAEGLKQVERLKVPLARQQLDQAEQEHRNATKAQTRADLSPRQVRVLQDECKRLEQRMDALERQLSPLQERLDLMARQYQTKLDQLEDCKRAMQSSDLRQKGAAVARFFHQVILKFEQRKRGSRLYGEWVDTVFLLTPDGMAGMLRQPSFTRQDATEYQLAEEYNSGESAGRRP